MIAYNKTWLANLAIRERVKNDAEKGLITQTEYKAITAKYHVGFYTPNTFVRIGLAVLTCVIILFSDGLLSLMIFSAGTPNIGGWFMFLGILSYIALEVMVAQKFHYQSGVDDALLIISALQFGGGLCALITSRGSPDNMVIAGVSLLLCAFLALRFADRLISAAGAVSLLVFFFYMWLRLIPAGTATVPFAMILFSGLLYRLSLQLIKQDKLVNYHNCLHVVQVIALTAFYAAGNYYIVQNLGAEMLGRPGAVPLGFLFWIWTFAIPVIYIVLGLRKKEATLLRIGIILIAAAGFTFRAYYHLLPIEIMLTIIGAALLTIVFALSRYLKTPKHGITAEEPLEKHTLDKLKVESLVSAGTFSHTPQAPANHDRFGGGDFGGGGSSSKF